MVELDREVAALLAAMATVPPVSYAEIGVDAARTVSADRMRKLALDPPAVEEVRDSQLNGLQGLLSYRTYDSYPNISSKPAILFLHGGGWVFGSLDSHDAVCRQIALKTGFFVLSLDYRLAPEHPFPAAVDDSIAGFRWLVEHADTLGIQPENIAVVGDSAGANLAANVCLAQRDCKGVMPRAAALIYGAYSSNMSSQSHAAFGGGDYFFSTETMAWFLDQYVPEAKQREDLRFDINSADLADLPPLYVSIAECDPLVDDGERFCERTLAAGNHVERSVWTGMIHGCIQMGRYVSRVDGFLEEVAEFLKANQRPSTTR